MRTTLGYCTAYYGEPPCTELNRNWATVSWYSSSSSFFFVLFSLAVDGLAALLIFPLVPSRIGCLRGKICFTRYKGRRHDRSPCLLPSSAGLDDNPTKGSTVTSQHTIQVPFSALLYQYKMQQASMNDDEQLRFIFMTPEHEIFTMFTLYNNSIVHWIVLYVGRNICSKSEWTKAFQ